LCAGLIGFRAFRLLGPVKTVGLYGFGSSAHILIQILNSMKIESFVFTRPKDKKTQEFALSLGASWAGDSDTLPPKLLDGAILFAPAGELFPLALKAIKRGKKVISAGIHMSDIPSFSYDLLWGEKSIGSTSNLTHQDGIDFMKIAENIPLDIKTTLFPLEKANEALAHLKKGLNVGSIVLKI
jgi:propanol-preferring alcohol dehydrogenase